MGVAVWSCTTNTTKTPIDLYEEKPEIVVIKRTVFEQPEETKFNPVEDQFKFALATGETDNRPTRDRMIEEVVTLWNMWYDDQSMRKSNRRRKEFPRLAEYLVDAVRLYQENKTDIGGQLPKDKNTHLVVATMVVLEIAVRPEVIGRSHGEVGLIQIHGKAALNGYTKHEVIRNPKLGLLLGVRWLAFHTQYCHSKKRGIDKWAQPLSLYGAGLSGGRKKNGQCKEISVARKRVRLTKFYRTRINNAMDS